MAAALAVVVALGGVVGFLALRGGGSSGDVALAPVSSTGPNPFTAGVGTDTPGVAPVPNTGRSFSGGMAGLYGGTRQTASCDQQKMISFLQANPAKAAAWAGVLGIATTDIAKYASGLTPVVLRSDTLVTNHGFANGRANFVPAVLQAGTAVLVDQYGFPVTKCYCGNPLTRPVVYRTPRYIGPQWLTFHVSNITVITQATATINAFTLVDLSTNQAFRRPRGTSGGSDTAISSTAPPPTTTTAPTAVSPPPAPRATSAPDATQRLLDAWAHNDRSTASRYAEPQVVDFLFKQPPQGAQVDPGSCQMAATNPIELCGLRLNDGRIGSASTQDMTGEAQNAGWDVIEFCLAGVGYSTGDNGPCGPTG